jgi:transcriptional regulator NrdR family protein
VLCPQCKKSSRVLDTRQAESVVRRRRECLDKGCAYKWWTVEMRIGRIFPFTVLLGPNGPEIAKKT